MNELIDLKKYLDKERIIFIKRFEKEHPVSYLCIKEEGRKQGALEELRNILKESEILFEKDRDFRELYNNLQIMIDLRIKELEEGVEK